MSSTRVVSVLLVLGCGCVFDRSGMRSWTADGSDREAQAADRWSDPDQPRDTQPVDREPLPVDQQPVDQVPLDLPPVLCATKYGSVNGFVLCSETATECVFYFVGGNCNDHCGKNGGTCIKSAEDIKDSCSPSVDRDCGFNHNDGLCYCSR